MKCPHCLVEIHDKSSFFNQINDIHFTYDFTQQICPACSRLILKVKFSKGGETVKSRYLIPFVHGRKPCPPEVTDPYKIDYNESCAVFPYSKKASAALSRRCLQSILRDKGKISESNLSKEIDEAITSNKLPSHISESIDAIRNVGNFAAHPIKSQNTGEVIDVEEGEAEWLLDVLELLFDFYFVQPEIVKKKKDALNQKLMDAGKPPMK